MGEKSEILIEYTVVGDYVRVAAVDPQTGVEVIVMGPAHASKARLERIAAAKLARALDCKTQDPDPPPRRGLLA